MIVSEKELCKSNEADSSSSERLGKAIIALLVIAAFLIAALAGAWIMFGTQLTAAMTIEKLLEAGHLRRRGKLRLLHRRGDKSRRCGPLWPELRLGGM